MNKRPNPILHTTIWGGVSGLIITLIGSLVFMYALFHDTSHNFWGIWLSLNWRVWLQAMLYGLQHVVFGTLIIGFAVGLALKSQLFFRITAIVHKKQIYLISLILPFLLVMLMWFTDYQQLQLNIFGLVPSAIASIIGLLATHHYLFRIRHWRKK